ncbi:hypothetical protein [Nocardia sp. CA-119907]|uniref:hypothetical protein n=1 Tax=Nocardia sp. CA-119907 TaxID=3239973 RepID=UPI003D96C753
MAEPELVWDLIENTVSEAELRAAVAAIDQLVPQADPEFDSQRLGNWRADPPRCGCSCWR